ncbi:hypothetical protein ACH4NV_20430 [Streptomyces althioticus]|uniref:hypothetical protein n=1 Tax=Streptomyces althioticus TaxID=83380 RepID=UPI0037BBCBBE
MSRSRLRAGAVRKYFVDAPDPEMLTTAQQNLTEADAALARVFESRTKAEAVSRRMRIRRRVGAGVCAFLVLTSAIGDSVALAIVMAIAALILAVKSVTVPQRHAEDAEGQARMDAKKAQERKSNAEAAIREYQRLYDLAEPKPSDEELDRTLAQDIAAVRDRAMRSLSLSPGDLVRPSRIGSPDDIEWSPFNSDDPHEPFVVYGPAFGEGLKVSSAVGKDGRRRYGRYSVMVICTTRYHIAVYRCVLDFFTGQLNNESTMEMHYQDVVSVRTHSDPDPGRRIEIEPRQSQKHLFPRGTERCFELIVSGGVTLRMVTGLTHRETTQFRQSGEEGVVYQGEDPDFQAVADSVRMMLREKKGGVEGPSFLP